MTIAAFFDVSFLATLPGRRIEPAVMDSDGTVRSGPLTLYSSDHSPYARSICVQPHVEKRAPFTVGSVCVCVRTMPKKATLELYDRLSNLLIEVDTHLPLPIPDYHVLWPGKPTTNTIATFVEDYEWFEAFSEEGCATGIACTPPHMGCAGLQRAEERRG